MACRRLLERPRCALPSPFAAFRIESTVAGDGSRMFTLFRAADPLVTCGVAWTPAGQAEIWPALESLYLNLGDQHPELLGQACVPICPASLPWLAVVLLPAIALQSRDDVGWFGDFERCLAWAMIES